MIVVADAGPLIHLSLVRLLRLLPILYERILVPDLVYNEVVREGDTLPGSAEVHGADWIERIPYDADAPPKVKPYGFPGRVGEALLANKL